MKQKKDKKLKTDARPKKEPFFQQPHIDIFQANPLVRYYQLINDAKDDRSRIIMINIIIENQIDLLLGLFITDYNSTFGREFTYAKKLLLLKSFNLLPDTIFLSADCLRQIRNKFAHSLNMTSNESLPANLVQLVNKTFILSLYKQERDKAFSMKDKIDRLVFSAMVGFYSYEPNIRSLKAEMDSDTFKGELEKKYKERLRDQHKLIDEMIQTQSGPEYHLPMTPPTTQYH